MNALVSYLVLFFCTLCPVRLQGPPVVPAGGEEPEAARARYASIAEDIAHVASEPSEPPLFRGNRARERTALVLAALAFEESGLRADVDRGECTRGDPRGDSDGCEAVSLWQVHARGGIALEGVTFRKVLGNSAFIASHPDLVVVQPEDLARDRVLAVRVALHMARRSLGNWTRGRAARGDAERFWQAHPFGQDRP